ncbi:MAG: hypothetical protein HY363_05095 [Candidatus Aenigmarchaeota archaeon]|nr:hypothetical protein [Candidatus Aenigmarchaeota archaeon]
MPTIIDPVVRLFVDIGLVDVILPFMLVFAVVFGVVEQSKIFGQRRNVNIAVAVISGLLVIASADLLGAINRMSAFLSIVLLTGLLVMMLFGLVGVQSLEKSKPLMYVLFAIFLFGTLYVLGAFELVSRRSLLNYFLPAVLIFVVFVLLVWSVLKVLPEKKSLVAGKKSEEKPKPEKEKTLDLAKKWNAIPAAKKEELINDLSDDEKEILNAHNAVMQKAASGKKLSEEEIAVLSSGQEIMKALAENLA